ncbi:MAG: hypothetical protein V1834_03435 [Candidatus Micrarchaeota archaeon]
MKITIASFDPALDCTLLAKAVSLELRKQVEVKALEEKRALDAVALLESIESTPGRTLLLYPGPLFFEGKTVPSLSKNAGNKCVVSFQPNYAESNEVTDFEVELVSRSLHALGHCYGLKHCGKECAMNPRGKAVGYCGKCKSRVY